MWVSRFFVWFVVYSCMGWLYETLYCTVKSGKWANRGFLYGPMCPIYGVGALGISAVYEHLRWEGGGDTAWWQIFVIAVLGSVVLEYSTSWLLEKMFHAYWGDYSDSPLNINGRVCLPASLAFGVAGLVVVYLVYPVVHRMTAGLTGPAMELVSLILMAYMAADATLTVSALTGLEENVAAVEESVNRQMCGGAYYRGQGAGHGGPAGTYARRHEPGPAQGPGAGQGLPAEKGHRADREAGGSYKAKYAVKVKISERISYV